MANPAAQLRAAVEAGHVAATTAALADGADPNTPMFSGGITVLHAACQFGRLACMDALLAADADPNAHGTNGRTPLHLAALGGHTACAAALLFAGADPTAADMWGWTALHYAALNNNAAIVRLLLEAAPQTASAKDLNRSLPLAVVLVRRHYDAARCLLELGTLPPAAELLTLMEAAQQEEQGAWVLPLYAPLVARQPLTPTEWQRVPAPCPGLGAALPAVLQRSAEEAAQLVRRLPPPDRERLRTAALCLARAQRLSGAALPADIVRLLLATAVAERQHTA